jgi:cytochrome b6-f complex iron-sulfur subunit
MSDKKENQHALSKGSRRSFLVKIWIGLGFVALLEFIGVVTVFLFPGKRRVTADNFKTVIEAGPADKFPLDSVTAFVRGKFYLVRLDDGGFLALSRKCTHLGCTVPWVSKEKKFVCPCHSSTFDIRGAVVSPPAPRALDIYHVFIENTVVKVDTAKKIKRTEFRSEHIVYPESV